MTVVAFLPTADSINPYAAGTELSHTPFVISPPPHDIRWVAHVAGHLAKTAEPLVLVFVGETAVHAPALGFSRRSLHRPAVGYVLIDPVMPQIGGDYGDWPDAPVTVILTDEASDIAKEASLQSRLRGWQVTNSDVFEVLKAF
jgi:hypothetical protein